MSQLAIDFDTGGTAPYQRHSRISRRAAEAMEPRAGTKRAQVLDFLRSCGPRGATDEEMQRRIPMVNNTQRPRRIELVAARLVKDSGRTRKTCSGEDAVVWVATSHLRGGSA